ncbi:hypothetical protein BASA81_010250 [Batrachochytrium salamandrivorans]|nr:hypothetical protein BASA81_010250 [Batrachochytrium salamandrivorans]
MWMLADRAGGSCHALRGGSFTVGRDPSSSLVLADSSVSRKHAEFTFPNNALWQLKDLKSTFGTFVNGERLSAHVLTEVRAGDLVQFGESGKSVFVLQRALGLCTSGLTSKENELIRDICEKRPGLAKVCSGGAGDLDTTHVVLPNRNWRVTSKVLLGLFQAREFVTLDWVVEFGNTGRLPALGDYKPGPLSAMQTESLMMASQQQQGSQAGGGGGMEVDFSPHRSRSGLFAGMEFIAVDEEACGMEVELLEAGGGSVRKLSGIKPTGVLVCTPNVDSIRAQFIHLAHLPAVDKTLIIHSVLTATPLVPIKGVVEPTPVVVAKPLSSPVAVQPKKVLPPVPVQTPPVPTKTPTAATSSKTKAKLRSRDFDEDDDGDGSNSKAFSRARVAPSTDAQFTQPAPRPVPTVPPPQPVVIPFSAPPASKPQITVFPELASDSEWTVVSGKRPAAMASTVNVVTEPVVVLKRPPTTSSATVNFKKFRKNSYIPGGTTSTKRHEVEVPIEATLAVKQQDERDRNELRQQERIMMNAFGGVTKTTTRAKKPAPKRVAESDQEDISE